MGKVVARVAIMGATGFSDACKAGRQRGQKGRNSRREGTRVETSRSEGRMAERRHDDKHFSFAFQPRLPALLPFSLEFLPFCLSAFLPCKDQLIVGSATRAARRSAAAAAGAARDRRTPAGPRPSCRSCRPPPASRSEEHTSELQSLTNLVCRL